MMPGPGRQPSMAGGRGSRLAHWRRPAPAVRPYGRQDGGVMAEHYDVIIIGTGAGGGTLAHTLAGSGKRILLVERGDFLPREMDNWDPRPVFVEGKYISTDTWFGSDGKPFQPQVHYFVGGPPRCTARPCIGCGRRTSASLSTSTGS